MKKVYMSILMCLFFLTTTSIVSAEDPLNAKQRDWINRQGKINVGLFTNYPPFGFVDNSGEPQGMAVDYWRLLSSHLNCWIQFYPAENKDLLEGLKNGKYDSMPGMIIYKERAMPYFDFTEPYTSTHTNIYVKPKHAHIRGLQDLKSLKVGVVEGDSGQILANEAELNPSSFANYIDAVFDLANGSADAIVMNEFVADYFIYQHHLEEKIKKIKQPLEEGIVTLPVKKGNAMLLNILNRGVDTISEDEWNAIVERWLGNKNAMK